jgi:hypothetical protein
MPEAALPFSPDMFKPMLILVEYPERKALHPLEISNFEIVGSFRLYSLLQVLQYQRKDTTKR